jgi:hypothetical protein
MSRIVSQFVNDLFEEFFKKSIIETKISRNVENIKNIEVDDDRDGDGDDAGSSNEDSDIKQENNSRNDKSNEYGSVENQSDGKRAKVAATPDQYGDSSEETNRENDSNEENGGPNESNERDDETTNPEDSSNTDY